MPGFRLTPDAQTDLIEIRRFTIRQWSKAQSQKYLSELQQTIRLLVETPSLGKSRPDVGPNVLSFPCSSHIIYYVVYEQQLVKWHHAFVQYAEYNQLLLIHNVVNDMT